MSQSVASVVAPALDGRVFRLEVSRPGAKPVVEQLVFDEGFIVATECVGDGFAPGPYRAHAVGDAILWEAEQESPTAGRVRWIGTVIDGHIRGLLWWDPPRGAAVRWHFEGTST